MQPVHADILVQGPFPSVLGNEVALTQCLSNLLGNAVKFVGPGIRPGVHVSAEQIGNRVRLRVSDNGIGMAPKDHERIFGSFERLNTGYKGSGIGLAIVKRAVQRMEGPVSVESQLGQGSRSASICVPLPGNSCWCHNLSSSAGVGSKLQTQGAMLLSGLRFGQHWHASPSRSVQ